MNLTNDNPIGCQQIASCGGLDTMATLITCHFPLFNSFSFKDSQMLEDISFSQSSTDPDHLKGKHLSDQELDFLVVILGLLVNLVEKDKRNRLFHYYISLPALFIIEASVAWLVCANSVKFGLYLLNSVLLVLIYMSVPVLYIVMNCHCWLEVFVVNPGYDLLTYL